MRTIEKTSQFKKDYKREKKGQHRANLEKLLTGTAVWSMRKYKKLAKRITYAAKRMVEFAKENKQLFAHWRIGIVNAHI